MAATISKPFVLLHFFLHCHYITNIRLALLDKLVRIDSNISTLSYCEINEEPH